MNEIFKESAYFGFCLSLFAYYIGILIRENDNHIKSRERRFIIYSDTRKIDTPGFCVLGGRNICKNILT